MFTEEINNYIADNLSKIPSELKLEIKKLFRVDLSSKQLYNKLFYLRRNLNKEYGIIKKSKSESTTRQIEKGANGTKSENVPVKTTNLSPETLLSTHGLDPKEFDLVRVWYTESQKGGFLSSIFAKPRLKGISISDLIKELKKDIKPSKIITSKTPPKTAKNYIINFADMHLGVTKLSDLETTLLNIKNYFASKDRVGSIYINLLGDEFHSSQVDESITLSGTILDDVNMLTAISDAQSFYDSLFNILARVSSNIILNRTPGNHDGNISYLFTEYLKAKYPQIKINNTNQPRTYFNVGNVGIMLTHGHLGKKQDYINLFASEGKKIFSTTETHIILTGHRHTELVEQNQAATIYQVGTCKPAEKWSTNQGYVSDTRTRNWQIMKLDENEILSVSYI